jgi:GAF domain-containing protein
MVMVTTSGEAFAAANAAMVRGVDGASTVHVLLADCVELLGAATAGILVRVGDQHHELLASTSHEATALELYQSQVGAGPCVDAITLGHSVRVSGDADLVERWPGFGRAMSSAGLSTAHAEPMRWRDRVLGGVNLFWTGTKELTRAEEDLASAFSDICTLALMQVPASSDPATVTEQVRAALHGRVVIERAKGVLAQTEGLEMGRSFDRLVEMSRERDLPLTAVAQQVLDDVVRQPR